MSGTPALETEHVQGLNDAQAYIVDQATDEVLRLNLDKFQGPFEILLYLIKSQEVDIFDIPIALITDQYLQVLDLIREDDLEMAGDFIVMAATLIQIKSKMIIPDALDDEEEEEIDEDPRMELVEKLLEYRKYQEITELLHEMEVQRQDWFTRNVKPKIEADPNEDLYFEASLYDLTEAFKSVLRFITDDLEHTVEGEGASVDEKIEYILGLLAQRDSVAWTDIFEGIRSRVDFVCCFLAILELCRMGDIRAQQHGLYGEIRLFRAIEVNVA